MGHNCDFFGTLTLHGDDVVMEVTAKWKNKQAVVYEEHEDGKFYNRYMYFYSGSGWKVAYPGERISSGYYYGQYIQMEEDLTEYPKRINVAINWNSKEEDLDFISKARPDLKYLIKKMDNNISIQNAMDVIKKYKVNKSIESLVEKKYINISVDKRLEKLSKAKRNEVINFLKNNQIHESTTLTDILFCIKNKVNYKDIGHFQYCHYQYKLGKYLKNKNLNIYTYKAYKEMLENLDKKLLKDDYWLYPCDFWKKHNDVMQKLEAKREAERIAELERRKKEEQKEQNNLLKISEKLYKIATVLNKKDISFNGYDIYIPESIKDIQKQAKDLNQCLITMKYYEKMAKKHSLLVFIRKKGKALATAQINYNKEILQFYGNEADRNNCKPNEEISNTFNLWLKDFDLNKSMIASV